MGFVLDASVTAAWLLPDEENPMAEFVHELLLDERALVPVIWWFEVRNLVIVAERRKRIDLALADELIGNLADYSVDLDCDTVERTLMEIVRGHGLTVYDSAYVELAHRLKLPLATLDKRMAAAAQAMNVRLVLAP